MASRTRSRTQGGGGVCLSFRTGFSNAAPEQHTENCDCNRCHDRPDGVAGIWASFTGERRRMYEFRIFDGGEDWSHVLPDNHSVRCECNICRPAPDRAVFGVWYTYTNADYTFAFKPYVSVGPHTQVE